MGWDVKATADGVVQSLPALPTISSDVSLPQAANWVIMGLLVLAVASALVRLLPKLWSAIEQTLFTNWRLALIGGSALLLSPVAGPRGTVCGTSPGNRCSPRCSPSASTASC